MAIFNSYVSLPEGTTGYVHLHKFTYGAPKPKQYKQSRPPFKHETTSPETTFHPPKIKQPPETMRKTRKQLEI